STHQDTVPALPSPLATQCIRVAHSALLGHPDSLRSGCAVDIIHLRRRTGKKIRCGCASPISGSTIPKRSSRFLNAWPVKICWSRYHACRVVEEYKRFCYLALVAGQPVTPSEDVDEAWHLHLLDTRNYWDDFCRDVLRHPLHHAPTRGGPEERAKFRD